MSGRLVDMVATMALLASVSAPVYAAWPLGPLAAVPSFQATLGDHLIVDNGGVNATPGANLTLSVSAVPRHADLVVETDGALRAQRVGAHRWQVHVGRTPGIASLLVLNRATGEALPVSVFVPQPFDATKHRIDGYRIGHYQPTPRHDDPIYAPPDALLRVGRADTDAHLSPDFTIGQFLCHQQPRQWPKFALVRPVLVDKLEAILAAVRAHGIDADTLTVMSGYRTPHYNAKIGNTTVYSRHLYGGAADIYVDTNHDDEMDDLNRDGVIDVRDAEWLAQLVDAVDTAEPRFAGGLSAYPATAYHGPFVHVDVRGTAVRW